jgi:hypothetical protein
MEKIKSLSFTKASVLFMLLVILVRMTSYSQSNGSSKPQKIDCMAYDPQTQMGQMGTVFKVKILIQEYSPPEDRETLLQAFNQAGNKGLYNAVTKMHSKGRISMAGTVGFDINYVTETASASGRTIRLVTNRPVSIGDLPSSSRAMSYDLCILELNIPNDKDAKGNGKLLPAAQLKLNKKTGEIELETYKFPWRLEGVIARGEK